MSLPSIFRSDSFPSTSAAIVGSRSNVPAGSLQVVAAGIVPVHHQTGSSYAAFKRRQLAFAKDSCRSCMIAVRKERPIVGHKDDQRRIVQIMPREGVQNFANGPVEFFNDIAVQPARRPASEFVRCKNRHAGHDMRHVQGERLFPVCFNECDARSVNHRVNGD